MRSAQVGQHAALLRIAGAQRRYLSDALQRIAGLEARRIGAVQEAIATFLANYQCACLTCWLSPSNLTSKLCQALTAGNMLDDTGHRLASKTA